MSKTKYGIAILFILYSCANHSEKTDCKILIAKTWQWNSMDFDKDLMRRRNLSYNKKTTDKELDAYIEDAKSKVAKEITKRKILIAFTSEGIWLDENSTRVGKYKITLDCSRLLLLPDENNGSPTTKVDTNEIKQLTNDKLIVENNFGEIKEFKSVN